MGYAKLFSEIITSSIWNEPNTTRLVWITMLALKDRHGYVASSLPGLSVMARVSVEECEEAVKTLESPDKYSRTKDHEGRRISPVDGGWIVLNHTKYLEKMSTDQETASARERQKRHREKIKIEDVNKDVDVASRVTGVTPVTVTHKTNIENTVHTTKFIPPTIEESITYGKTIGLPEDECRKFHAHHDTRDWILATGKMKRWKSAMATWQLNYKSGIFSGRGKFNMKPVVPIQIRQLTPEELRRAKEYEAERLEQEKKNAIPT